MAKLIWIPLAILLVPQVPVQIFFIFANYVLGRSHEWDVTRVVITGAVMAISIAISLGNLFGIDGLIEKYLDEQRALRKQQERERQELRAKIDAELGIPTAEKSRR